MQRNGHMERSSKRRNFANPCFTQIHPTCIPVSGDFQSKLTLMSESLRNDGRVWVPKDRRIVAKKRRGFPRKSEITTWSAFILVSEISFRETLHRDEKGNVRSRQGSRTGSERAASWGVFGFTSAVEGLGETGRR